jgi:hypothetical protein
MFQLDRIFADIFGGLRLVPKHIISGLGAALAAVVAAFWLYAASGATSAKGQTGSAIPLQDLQGSLRAESMPVQRFEDQSVIYPGARN